jgi:MtfA peptidase
MEDESYFPIILVLLLVGFMIISAITISVKTSSFLTQFWYKWIGWKSFPEIQRFYLPYLVRSFPFYSRLDDRHRRLFEGRVQQFINDKEFIPRGGIKDVSDEMKALIAGCAVQITFGYPNIRFGHFNRVLIYPDDYYSTITRQYHKGEVNSRGIIVLSWSNLVEGFRDPTDGLQLGFHEMAHALRLINIVDNDEYDFYDRELMEHFDFAALMEIRKIRLGEGPSLFRNYASANSDEFFAVSVEVFFEQSDVFYAYNPQLYTMLSTILKLDPRSGKPIRVVSR